MIKFGFVTCVQLGLSCIESIYELGGKLELAITLTDKQAQSKSGRVYLDDFCNVHNLPLFKSSHVNNQDVIDAIKRYDIDWLFIIGWSQIANIDVLNAPNRGVLGIHPTLLPKGRGRASIPWAIIKGLDKTGITMFKLDAGVDTGPIVSQLSIPLTTDTNATHLYKAVNQAHIELMKRVFPLLANDSLFLTEQDHSSATEWPGRKPEDGLINLSGSVFEAERLVRALTAPYPGAFFFKDGEKVIVHSAKIVDEPMDDNYLNFGDGFLQLVDFQIIPVL